MNMKNASTMADRLSRPTESGAIHWTRATGRRLAFTMAEILLSLTIIGVVAAITLPSLTGNINERTWNTQRKALYTRMSQAISLMPALNGYGNYNVGDSSTSAQDNVAETFVTEGLAKVLKINNICDSEHLEDCGIPQKILAMDGTSAFSTSRFPTQLSDFNSTFTSVYTRSDGRQYSNPQKDINTKPAAFETINGESIVVFYNPYCQSLTTKGGHMAHPFMCANFVYDLNGNKGPNTMGKDIGFITVLYPTDSIVVAPLPLISDLSGTHKQFDAGAACKDRDSESRLPNKEELMAVLYNKNLINLSDTGESAHWTSSIVDSETAYYINFVPGNVVNDGGLTNKRNNGLRVRCVKR